VIFVSVGMHHQGFDRLIRAMDALAPSLADAVIMQIGAGSYEPLNARFFRFASSEEVDALVRDARVVVAHCGVGSIISALKHAVPVVVVPRLRRFAEHVDDHQLELARVLGESGRATVLYDVEGLQEAICRATPPPVVSDRQRDLVNALSQCLGELAGKPGREVVTP
jgi:beta-1,4-N-acetylglucosaminyltransferase